MLKHVALAGGPKTTKAHETNILDVKYSNLLALQTFQNKRNVKTSGQPKKLNLVAPQATTKVNPNIVLNYVYKKAAMFKKEVPSADTVREA